jgi:hypothetical protein
MSARAPALNAVKVGDVIFGIAGGGQEKLLLVYDADDNSFWARHVASQTTVRFGRDGKSQWVHDGGTCTIVSTAQLPPDMHVVAVGLDRKFAARPEYPATILSEAEIRLLRTHGEFFKAQLLPGTESIVKAAEKLNAVRAILQLEWDPIYAQDNPPAWDEYGEDIPALLDLLDRQASVDAVVNFLASMASRRTRTLQIAGRGKAAAASLARLSQSWT